MNPISVAATGMVTGVGFSTPACCAAVQCAIDNFQETGFVDLNSDPIIGSEVPLDPPTRGRAKLLRFAASAVNECLAASETSLSDPVPVLLCLSEESRPGRFSGLNDEFLHDLSEEVKTPFCDSSQVFCNGPIGGVQAVQRAFHLINEKKHPAVIVVGTDTLMVAKTLRSLDKHHRLLTPTNSNGLMPGEGAAALLLTPTEVPMPGEFVIRGCGFGSEPVTVYSEEPFRAEGLSAAIRDAFRDSRTTYDDVDFRVTDISGEQYGFKEAALAMARTMRTLKEEFDIWHPADCIGDVGAAIMPAMIVFTMDAFRQGIAAGSGVLFHCANDDEQRGAVMGSYLSPED